MTVPLFFSFFLCAFEFVSLLEAISQPITSFPFTFRLDREAVGSDHVHMLFISWCCAPASKRVPRLGARLRAHAVPLAFFMCCLYDIALACCVDADFRSLYTGLGVALKDLLYYIVRWQHISGFGEGGGRGL